MGSSPIARSIFHLAGGPFHSISRSLVLALAIECFFVSPIRAQTETDIYRPFDQGQVVFLPGMTAYQGDISNSVRILHEEMPFHTVNGSWDLEPGWLDLWGGYRGGIHVAAPSILFEGIPCPLLSTGFFGRVPVIGSVELYDFPASAWWGSEASTGAVQIRVPDPGLVDPGRVSVWGGTGNYGGGGSARFGSLGLDLRYRHGMSSGISVSDGFSLASKETWLKDDGARFETGFLGTGVLTGDHWYSAYAAFRLYSPNFQTLEVKPFLQAADIGGQNVLQEGAHLNYLFNLGGVAKSHLGIGFGHDGPQVGSGIGSNNGFVRTANLIDLLGNATIDFSFRFDLSSVRPTMFSTIVGFQDRFGDVTFLGHYDKGVEPLTFQDVQEVTLGVRCQPEEEWALTLQYLHEQVATTPFEGARANIQVEKTGPTMIFKKVGMDVGVQALQDPFQSLVFDTSIRFRAVFFGPDRSSILGRVLSNEPLYWEMGESVEVAKDVRSFVTAVNLGDVPIALPDADRPIGRSIIGGIEASF